MGTEATLQEQARALGDPTRHRVFRYIADSDRPVDVAELTRHFGLNHNAIRQHLAKLANAGLVTRDSSSSGAPGRPRLQYRIEPAAQGRWGLDSPYQRLSLLLVEVISTGSPPDTVGRRRGRSINLRSPATAEDLASVLQEAIARDGFQPAMQRRGETVEYMLENCPFADAAAVDPDTVCGIHRGICEGLADQLDGVTVDLLGGWDPHSAGCILRFHLPPTVDAIQS